MTQGLVRPPHPTDLVALLAFRRHPQTRALTTSAWPRVQPELRPLALLRLLHAAIRADCVWVALAGPAVLGMVSARPRAKGLIWDVEHLHVRGDQLPVATELLERVVERAGAASARRVLLELPAGDEGAEPARRAGFERYGRATLYVLRPPFKAKREDVFAARPRLRADELALFQLYNAAVPAHVRTAEAMTQEEWVGLHRGSRPWAPTIFGDRQQYVWELGATLAGQLEVVYGQRSQYLELLVHPRYEAATDKMLRAALAQTSEKAPVYCVARDYQAGLAAALEREGFRPVGESELFVRQVALRVRERGLVTAKAMSG
jgi:hypothetical protein